MKKWKEVYRNEHGYIEMKSFRPRIKKNKVTKRTTYSTLDKIIFLRQIKHIDDFKKEALKANIPYLTAFKWK